MTPLPVKIIRRVFGAADYVAPRLAGRVAFALFSRTPDRKRLTQGEIKAIRKAEPFMSEARHHRLKDGRNCVSAHEFRPQAGRAVGKTVLVLHGWRSRTDYMAALILGHVEAGFRVISLDLPGHGASTGRRLTLVDALRAVRLAADAFGPFAAVIGHSFGGAVAVNAIVGSVPEIAPVHADRLVLIAAPSSMPAIFANFGDRLNLGPKSRRVLDERVLVISGRPLDTFSGLKQLAACPIPTLVIHAPDDREVSRDHAEMYAAAGDHVRLRWVPGLGHRRILSDPQVVRDAVAFSAGDIDLPSECRAPAPAAPADRPLSRP